MVTRNILIMNKLIERIARAVVKKPKKLYQAGILKKTMRARSGDVLIENVQELNLLMAEGRAYLHDLEIPLLARYARKAHDTIVEIGCAFGASSAILLARTGEKVTVHSIDPFVVDSMAAFQATKEKCTKNVHRILSALGRAEKMTQWKLRPEYSYNLVGSWSTPIDMVFIDGDHRYEAVRADFDDWFPLVKTGGVILFHDSRKEVGTPTDTFNRGWAGPTRLAQELLSDNRVRLIDEAFSITVWEKVI